MSEPNKYAPLSPRKIFAFGKLNKRKDNKIIIWETNKNENSKFELPKLTYVNIILIIIKWIVRSPLNPSTKFAPLIINKKQTRTKIDENKLFVNKNFK